MSSGTATPARSIAGPEAAAPAGSPKRISPLTDRVQEHRFSAFSRRLDRRAVGTETFWPGICIARRLGSDLTAEQSGQSAVDLIHLGALMLDVGTVLAETRESPPCGPNLEHDLSFFELEEAARGKPEQRTGDAVKPAEEPNWPKVIDRAQALLNRSKDLRVAVHLTRALVCTEGFPGLATGLSLIHGLLERYWDGIHPVLEADRDNDPTERLNALAPLIDPEVIVKDLRGTYLVSSREQGQLRARDVEVALGRFPAPQNVDPSTLKPIGQMHSQIAAAFANDRSVPSALREARDHTAAIQSLIAEPVGGSS